MLHVELRNDFKRFSVWKLVEKRKISITFIQNVIVQAGSEIPTVNKLNKIAEDSFLELYLI